jgi:hypothetical protein
MTMIWTGHPAWFWRRVQLGQWPSVYTACWRSTVVCQSSPFLGFYSSGSEPCLPDRVFCEPFHMWTSSSASSSPQFHANPLACAGFPPVIYTMSPQILFAFCGGRIHSEMYRDWPGKWKDSCVLRRVYSSFRVFSFEEQRSRSGWLFPKAEGQSCTLPRKGTRWLDNILAYAEYIGNTPTKKEAQKSSRVHVVAMARCLHVLLGGTLRRWFGRRT